MATYEDVDSEGRIDDQRSISGETFYFDDFWVSWLSKK
jgi:hypothetical protein